jgi:hypothetical protein
MNTIWSFIKLCFLLIILGLIFHNFTAKLILKQTLQYQLGVPVEIQDAKVDLLGSKVTFQNIYLKNPDHFPAGFLARIPKLFLDWKWDAVRDGKFHLDALELDIQELRVIRNAEGQLNLLSLKVFEPNQKTEEELQMERDLNKQRFHIGLLTISLRRGTYTDLAGDAPIQRSTEIGMNNQTFRDIESLGDVVEIIAQRAVARLGLGAVLDQSIERFATLRPESRGAIGKVVEAIKGSL